MLEHVFKQAGLHVVDSVDTTAEGKQVKVKLLVIVPAGMEGKEQWVVPIPAEHAPHVARMLTGGIEIAAPAMPKFDPGRRM